MSYVTTQPSRRGPASLPSVHLLLVGLFVETDYTEFTFLRRIAVRIEEVLLLNKLFPIVDISLSCKDMAR